MEQAVVWKMHTLTTQEVGRRAFELMLWLEKFISKGSLEMTAKQGVIRALEEKLVLVLVERDRRPVAIIAFEQVEYPNLKALRVVGMAGREFRRWQKMATDYLSLCARALGAQRLEAIGRPGLGRLCAAQECARFFTKEV